MVMFRNVDGKTEVQHQADGVAIEIRFPAGFRQQGLVFFVQFVDQIWKLRCDSGRRGAIGHHARYKKLLARRRARKEEIEETAVSAVECDFLGGLVKTEGPLVNRTAALLKANSRKRARIGADSIGWAGRVSPNQFFGHFDIIQRRRHKNVRLRAPLEEETRDLGGIANSPLRRSGVVVIVLGVEFGTSVKKEQGCIDIAAEMQGAAPIAAFGIHPFRTLIQKLP